MSGTMDVLNRKTSGAFHSMYPESRGMNYGVSYRNGKKFGKVKYFKSKARAVSFARKYAVKKNADIFDHYVGRDISVKSRKKKRSSGGSSYNSIDRILWG
jgi:hypothetical protein